jgi:tellurium resistance protein TerZ
VGVTLSKGQKISLEKRGGGSLTLVAMGLGWDVAKVKGMFGRMKEGPDVDLDASCMVFDAGHRLVDQVWFNQLRSKDGSIIHTGDNRTGAGDGDDETINVDLVHVPNTVQTLVFTVNSFTGQSFDKIENAYCRLVDLTNNTEVARFNLSSQGSHTAQIMAKLYRNNSGWEMNAIGENCSGRTFADLLPTVKPYV